MLPKQKIDNYPDIVSRVFYLKVQFLLNDLKKTQVFGWYAGSVYTIEYQKRRLPYMHLLLFLHPEDRAHFRNVESIDQIISAEFFSAEDDLDGKLFDIASSTIVHGPCRDYNSTLTCMMKKAGSWMQCSKQFPKACQETTIVQKNSYSFYRQQAN